MKMTPKSRTLALVLTCAISASVSASADTIIDTFPPTEGFTDGWYGQAESFQTPAGDNELISWEFELDGRSSPGNVTFSIDPWSATGPTGPALFTTTVPWGTSIITPVVSGIDLVLNPSKVYAAVVDFQGYFGQSIAFGDDTYPGGTGFWYDGTAWNQYSEFDQSFIADFAPSSAVPDSSTIFDGAWVLLPFAARAMGFLRKNRAA
jgi:hypothetical protein